MTGSLSPTPRSSACCGPDPRSPHLCPALEQALLTRRLAPRPNPGRTPRSDPGNPSSTVPAVLRALPLLLPDLPVKPPAKPAPPPHHDPVQTAGSHERLPCGVAPGRLRSLRDGRRRRPSANSSSGSAAPSSPGRRPCHRCHRPELRPHDGPPHCRRPLRRAIPPTVAVRTLRCAGALALTGADLAATEALTGPLSSPVLAATGEALRPLASSLTNPLCYDATRDRPIAAHRPAFPCPEPVTPPALDTRPFLARVSSGKRA